MNQRILTHAAFFCPLLIILGTLFHVCTSAFSGIGSPAQELRVTRGLPAFANPVAFLRLRRTLDSCHLSDTRVEPLRKKGIAKYSREGRSKLRCSLQKEDDDRPDLGDSAIDVDRQPTEEEIERSKEFWLELASQKMAQIKNERQEDGNLGKTEEEQLEEVLGDVLTPVSPSGGDTFSEAEAKQLVREARDRLEGTFRRIDDRTQKNLANVLRAFRECRVGPHLFTPTDGYGHGDQGRETLDVIYAKLFGAEDALVRVQCFSGTHAIACALFAVLRPGDEMLAISGPPYDTLEEVIGTRKEDEELLEGGLTGSLQDFGVTYDQVELTENGGFDYEAIEASISPQTRLIHIQRSCGYQWRPSIPVEAIAQVIAWLKERWPDVVVFVDNCYGEFVEEREPTHVGADLIAGSLIKNPGGTLVPSGGYVIGKSKYVRAAKNRLSAPGVDGGATLGHTRTLYQGLFNAANVVGEALKGTALVAEVMAQLGYESNPPRGGHRTDIITAVKLLERDNLLSFCSAVQRNSPIGSYIEPTPGATVGYGDEVVFADGTFIDGSTLELSADGPLRPPFVAYCQGGTHWSHWAIVLEDALQGMRPRFSANGEKTSSEHPSPSQ